MLLNFYKLLKILNSPDLCKNNSDWIWNVVEVDKKEHTFAIYNDKAEFVLKYEEYFQLEHVKYKTSDEQELAIVKYAESLIDFLTGCEDFIEVSTVKCMNDFVCTSYHRM